MLFLSIGRDEVSVIVLIGCFVGFVFKCSSQPKDTQDSYKPMAPAIKTLASLFIISILRKVVFK